ncbi:MAG: hypothetical protein HGA70_06350 [Chlorobiaceae bacterium]|nr:hypothetical protein [Chlorobiaceae bacterium]NTW10461.1 hypothetical protein [Chlorobiaceae bacterium]
MTHIEQILPVDFSAITKEQMIFAVFGYLTVICSLFLLFILFSVIPALRQRKQRKRFRMEGLPESAAAMVPGEVSAAIALAVSLYLEELHDQETSILTIKKAGKSYSPWNSKIYNVINFNHSKR